MDLDTFVVQSEAEILAFAHAYREAQKTDDTFFHHRTLLDWWIELVAYMGYVELDEKFPRE